MSPEHFSTLLVASLMLLSSFMTVSAGMDELSTATVTFEDTATSRANNTTYGWSDPVMPFEQTAPKEPSDSPILLFGAGGSKVLVFMDEFDNILYVNLSSNLSANGAPVFINNTTGSPPSAGMDQNGFLHVLYSCGVGAGNEDLYCYALVNVSTGQRTIGVNHTGQKISVDATGKAFGLWVPTEYDANMTLTRYNAPDDVMWSVDLGALNTTAPRSNGADMAFGPEGDVYVVASRDTGLLGFIRVSSAGTIVRSKDTNTNGLWMNEPAITVDGNGFVHAVLGVRPNTDSPSNRTYLKMDNNGDLVVGLKNIHPRDPTDMYSWAYGPTAFDIAGPNPDGVIIAVDIGDYYGLGCGGWCTFPDPINFTVINVSGAVMQESALMMERSANGSFNLIMSPYGEFYFMDDHGINLGGGGGGGGSGPGEPPDQGVFIMRAGKEYWTDLAIFENEIQHPEGLLNWSLLEFNATVHNIGPVSSHAFKMSLQYASNHTEIVYWWWGVGLPANGITYFATNMTFSGPITLSIFIDPMGYADSDMGNNRANFTVVELQPVDLALDNGNVTFDPSDPKANMDVEIGVGVQNLGDIAGNATIRIVEKGGLELDRKFVEVGPRNITWVHSTWSEMESPLGTIDIWLLNVTPSEAGAALLNNNVTVSLPVRINTTPYVRIQDPVDEEMVKGIAPVTGFFRDTDGDDITLTFYLNGTLMGLVPSIIGENFTYMLDTLTLADGRYNITVIAQDDSHTVSSSVMVRVNNKVPEAKLLGYSPAADQVDVLNTSSMEFQVSVWNNMEEEFNFTWLFDGQIVDLANGSSWTFVPGTELAPGQYDLGVRAKVSFATLERFWAVNVSVDDLTHVPTLVLLSPAKIESMLGCDDNFSLEAEATDVWGDLVDIGLLMDGKLVNATVSNDPAAGLHLSVFMLSEDIDYTRHTFVLFASDLAGNNATLNFSMNGADPVACSGEPPYVRPHSRDDDSMDLPWPIILPVIAIIIAVAVGLGFMAWRANKGGRSGNGSGKEKEDVPSEEKPRRRAKD